MDRFGTHVRGPARACSRDRQRGSAGAVRRLREYDVRTGYRHSSVVLATGTAGGEERQLVASGQADGLSLSLQAETFGTGTGGFDPSPDELRITSHVFGDYGDREMVIALDANGNEISRASFP